MYVGVWLFSTFWDCSLFAKDGAECEILFSQSLTVFSPILIPPPPKIGVVCNNPIQLVLKFLTWESALGGWFLGSTSIWEEQAEASSPKMSFYFSHTFTLMQLPMLLLATHTTIIDLLATTTQLEPDEQVLLLSTRRTRSHRIATPLMVFEALAITKPCATECVPLGSVHATTISTGSCSLSCCAKFHRLVLSGSGVLS